MVLLMVGVGVLGAVDVDVVEVAEVEELVALCPAANNWYTRTELTLQYLNPVSWLTQSWQDCLTLAERH